jgi:DNA modification methylase
MTTTDQAAPAIRDRIRELRRVPAGTLVRNERNWRKHPEAQARAVRSVLESVGYADALLAREDEAGRLVLIDGHLRADTTPDQDVPVLVLDVTEAEADEILLTLDPLAGMAEADPEALRVLLDSVTITDDELRERLGKLAQVGTAIVQDTPPPRPQARTRLGDLYLLGDHRLLCGDATDPATVARVLDGAEPALMVTDPPYGVNYDPAWRADAAANGDLYYAPTRLGEVENDDRADWSAAFALFPGAIVYAWHAGLHSHTAMVSLMDAGFECRAQIIWSKPHVPIGRGHYNWRHEPCFYAVRHGAVASWLGDHSQHTVWQTPLDTDSGGHGTQKPVELFAHSMRNHEGDVYDPFLGSGTAIIAAEQLGRRCYALDIAPHYVDSAVARWEAFTGRTAERIEATDE